MGKMTDFANDLYLTMPNTKPSSAVVTNVTTVGVNMVTVPNNNCFAIQVVGSVGGTETTYVGKIQEASTSTGTWADITGAVFSTITSTTGAPPVQSINFQRTQPWLRYIGTIAGTTAGVALDVLIGGQKGQL